MANLTNYSNLYADLSQAAYNGREKDKMFARLNKNQQNEMIEKGYATYNFGDGAETLYLQPDTTVKTVTEKKFFGKDTEYPKGLLTDEKAGFNAYYVMGTPTIFTYIAF